MRLFQRNRFASFSPNTGFIEAVIALRGVVTAEWIWQWSRAPIRQVESTIARNFGMQEAICFDSGRSSLYLALQALGVKKGSVVAVQAYTCIVVINAITALGAEPLYIDIDKETLTMDPADFKRKLLNNNNVHSVIVQHTFGAIADTSAISQIAQKEGISVIEDCAHIIPDEHHQAQIGVESDAVFVSFGSDKAISSVRGGAVVTNNQDLGQRLREVQNNLAEQVRISIFKHLLFLIVFPFARPVYHLGIGKALLAVLRKTHAIARIMEPEEKKGTQPQWLPRRYHAALARVALWQLRILRKTNDHRLERARQYRSQLKHILPTEQSSAIPLQLVMQASQEEEIRSYLRQEGIVLSHDWSGAPLLPEGTVEYSRYKTGSCPVAEQVSANLLQLPTSRWFSYRDSERIIAAIKQYD